MVKKYLLRQVPKEMINRNPYAKYQQNQVQTANPEKLLLMLYDGAIKFIGQAKLAIEQRDFARSNDSIKRTQDIITELMSSLNMEIEISKNLYALYDYIYYALIQANIKKDQAVLDDVQKILIDLRETWAQAILMAKGQVSKASNGVNYSG